MNKELVLNIIKQIVPPLVAAVLASQWIGEIVKTLLKRKFEKEDKIEAKKDDLSQVFVELKQIQDNLNKITTELYELKSEVKKNNGATNALLFSELEKWLNKMELIDCWSSEGKKNFDDIMDMYCELGDGHSEELKARANKIQINNTLFHQKMSRYNNHKIAVMNGLAKEE